MGEYFLPGTPDVAEMAGRLTGGITREPVAEAGGLVLFAMMIAETGCECESPTPGEECLCCEARLLLGALDGKPTWCW